MPRSYVAIEGPVCAGKTTLAEGLLACVLPGQIVVIPDQADVVGGGANMPPPAPGSLAEESEALEHLLAIEARRFGEQSTQLETAVLGVVDRSFLTVIAHCAGLDRRQNIVASSFQALAEEFVSQYGPVIPDHVIYLDVSHEVQMQRNLDKFEDSSIFIDPVFNDGFRAYFRMLSHESEPPEILWLDGALPKDDILLAALAFLRSGSLL